MTPRLWCALALLLWVVGILTGWVAADAFDWWRRRRGSGRASSPNEPGRQLPRHIRRQRGRMIAARIARSMADEPGRLN